jgi:hypothetical protein
MAKKTKAQVEETVVETIEAPQVEEQAVVEAPKVKRLGIGKIVQDMILADVTRKNQDILDEIKSLYPNVNTSYACIAWYRSDLRKAGKIEARAKKVEV